VLCVCVTVEFIINKLYQSLVSLVRYCMSTDTHVGKEWLVFYHVSTFPADLSILPYLFRFFVALRDPLAPHREFLDFNSLNEIKQSVGYRSKT
jgi:hypothetical protein